MPTLPFLGAAYTPFFKETWEKKRDTEMAFSFWRLDTDDQHHPRGVRVDRMAGRPPAVLPTTKGSTSNRSGTHTPPWQWGTALLPYST